MTARNLCIVSFKIADNFSRSTSFVIEFLHLVATLHIRLESLSFCHFTRMLRTIGLETSAFILSCDSGTESSSEPECCKLGNFISKDSVSCKFDGRIHCRSNRADECFVSDQLSHTCLFKFSPSFIKSLQLRFSV